ncbi:MAG: hypothetical protein IKZ47_01885 [Clostridia bacterium]|nr:hypothetical protein [Clostridia bacterium]
MKKTVLFIFTLILALAVCACDSASNGASGNAKTVADVLNEQTGNTTSDNSGQGAFVPTVTDTNMKCDLDVTSMNATVAYSQVIDFWNNPGNYMGKIIKVRGTFKVITDNGRNYYSCNLGDATACCTAYVEFILKDPLKYPDQYPKVGEEFTVIGEFETYLENGYTFCQLKNASFC